ncbi:MAG: GAF domain-containing protein [Bacteroidales bacterium]|jgi:GAF domain-containing protein/HAMP domain-containing protein|nr:GAF domain-containing protein [Bacteroidales bacterium]
MKLKNLTIKRILLLTSFGIAIILISIAFVTNRYINNTFTAHNIISSVEKIYSEELQLRKNEKDFIIYETINPEFFKTGKSSYITDMHNQYNDIEKSIVVLQKEPEIIELNLKYDLDILLDRFRSYRAEMDKMSLLVRKKGFKDYGLIGDMRQRIHNLETRLKDIDNDQYTGMMLMLRRHEKDYLLRKDLKYKDKFTDMVAEFSAILKSDDNNRELNDYLLQYQELFYRVIDTDYEIGLTANDGVRKELNELVKEIESNLLAIRSTVQKSFGSGIRNAIYTLFIIFSCLSLFIILILMGVSNFIIKSISILRKHITKLGHGELPEDIKAVNNDEIANMKRSINNLTRNLKNTREFAIAVGNGNFEKDVDVFENKGDLGGSLVEMREKLIQVAAERKQQEEKDKQRLWINEGVALFSDILRDNISDYSVMGKRIISELVKYTGSMQGALFIVKQEELENTQLVLEASYALDRLKYLDKIVKPGEGLIGECYLEKDSIFITDIPDSYGAIDVSLGQFKPESIYISPLKSDSKVLGIIELSSLHIFTDWEKQFIDRIAGDIAAAISMATINVETQRLLEQSKKQTAELSESREELAQNLEEMQVIREKYEQREQELLKELEQVKTNIVI